MRRFRSEPAGGRSGPNFTSLAVGRRFVAAGRQDGQVTLLDSECRPVDHWPVFGEDNSPVVALSANESLLLVGGLFGGVKLLRVPSGETALELSSVHNGQVTGVAFGPGGTLITGSRDGTVQLWTPDGRPLMTLRETGPVVQLAVSAGSELTLLLQDETALRRWCLDRLHDELTALGLDPGYERPASTAASRPAPSHGLWMHEFQTPEFKMPSTERIEPQVDWDGRNRSFQENHALKNCSTRWTGYVRAPRPGRYRFRVELAEYSRLFLDGRLVLDRWEDKQGSSPEAEFDLPDRAVSLRLDHQVKQKDSARRLLWKRADDPGPFQVVPTEALFPGRADLTR